MKKITEKQQKDILIEMLEYIDDICRKNNITYFISGGTLIGAVRHKGFIPWDDDLDIEMPFKDYKKFIKLMKEEDKYNVNSPYDDDYYYFFTKITDKRTFLKEMNFKKIDTMGVFIDIFPIFNVPDAEKERIEVIEKFRKMEKRYFRFYGFEKYYYDEKLIKRIIKSIIFFPQFILKNNIKKTKNKMLNYMEELSNKNTNYMGFLIPPNDIVQPKEVYEDKTELEFEGKKVYAPIKYKEYLKNYYGDYMKLPPKEERVSPHNYDAYWK